MSVQDELNQIYQALRTLKAGIDPAVEKINEIAAALPQTDLLNQIIAAQTQHGYILKHILEALIGSPAVKVIFTIKVGPTTTEGATKVKIKDNQEFDVSLAFQDAAGNPAQVQGAPTWTVDNEAVLAISPSADGLSAVVAAVGPTGTGQVSVSANADVSGDGQTNTITGVLAVEVIAGDATLIVLNSGSARDKAAPAPTPTPAPPPTPPTP